MKKVILISFILTFAYVTLAQNKVQDTLSYITKEYYLNDFIFYKQDTFLVVRQVEEYTADQIESENSNASLFIVKDGIAKLLVEAVVEQEDKYLGVPVENSMQDYAQTCILDMFFDYEDDDMNEMGYEYYNSNNIIQLKSNVIEISSATWAYEGGMHGYGFVEYSYFDLDEKDYFKLLDCYNEDVLDFIYDKVKIAFFKNDELGSSDIDEHLESFFEDLDQRTFGNRDLGSHQYYFSKDGLHVQNQMYGTLYEQDEFYIGYNNWEILIPYKKINEFLIEDSAIDRMLR